MEDTIKEGKIEYLQMLQEPICRMSTVSAIFKGFSATIVAGIASLSYSDINAWVLGLSFLPVVAFALLDIYYLILERKFRFLYDQIRLNKHDIDFCMELTSNATEIKSAKAGIFDCLRAPSIYLFYPLMIAILVAITIMKLNGTI